MNTQDTEARRLTYIEFSQHFVWDRSLKKWNKRKMHSPVSRIQFISPSVGEEYYLNILLTIRKGAISFEDLRTVDGILYSTFQDACAALALL